MSSPPSIALHRNKKRRRPTASTAPTAANEGSSRRLVQLSTDGNCGNNKNGNNKNIFSARQLSTARPPTPPLPPPPPPPPKALVQLLQRNASVLRYFEALHENLVGDVDRWKHRAKCWKQECEDLHQQINNLNSQKIAAMATSQYDTINNAEATKGKSICETQADNSIDDKLVGSDKYLEDEATDKLISRSESADALAFKPAADKRDDTKLHNDNLLEQGIPDSAFEFELTSSSDDDDNFDDDDENGFPSEMPKQTTIPSVTLNHADVLTSAAPLLVKKPFDLSSSSSSSLNSAQSQHIQKVNNETHLPKKDSTRKTRQGALKVDRSLAVLATTSTQFGQSENELGKDYQKDILFELDSSTSSLRRESDDEYWDLDNVKNYEKSEHRTGRDNTTRLDGLDQQHYYAVQELLVEAYQSFSYLGISLVNCQPKSRNISKIKNGEQDNDKQDPDKRLDQSVTDKSGANDNHSFALSSNDGENQSENEISNVIITRRSNVDVATAIVCAIRNITCLQTLDPELQNYSCYAPFIKIPTKLEECDSNNSSDGFSYIPACDVVKCTFNNQDSTLLNDMQQSQKPLHPAVKAKHVLFRALLILDGFCFQRDSLKDSIDNVEEDSWDLFFHLENHHHDTGQNMNDSGPMSDLKKHEQEEMRIGLKDRKRMVSVLIESLAAELTEVWARQDRSLQESQKSLHYYHQENSSPCAGKFIGSLNSNSKSHCQPYYSSLLERYWLAQIVSGMYLARNDWNKASTVVLEYIFGSTSVSDTSITHLVSKSDNIENNVSVDNYEFARLPPILSLVVLEGLLVPCTRIDEIKDGNTSRYNTTCWFEKYITTRSNDSKSYTSSKSNDEILLLAFLKRCILETAAVNKLRALSHQSRISLLARVELASYDRIRAQLSWLQPESHLQNAHYDISSSFDILTRNSSNACCLYDYTNALQLFLIRGDDVQMAKDFMLKMTETNEGHNAALASAKAYRQLILRRLDDYRNGVGGHGKKRNIDYVHFENVLDRLDTEGMDSHQRWSRAAVVLDCANIISDTMSAVRCIYITACWTDFERIPVMKRRNFIDSLINVCNQPVIRVINLKRRFDRFEAFFSQALAERIMLVRAVAHFTCTADSASMPVDGHFFGLYALDGAGRMAQVHETFLKAVEGSAVLLNAMIKPNWHPNHLKPFDKDAPSDERLVTMTDTEIACALSHIASWKGALRSLQIPDATLQQEHTTWHVQHIQRLMRISGFAEGPSLTVDENDSCPTPVCVIMEDDVILCDRFRERLNALLQELPRDFHFCSIGYSRPKTAPILPFSELIGIPSHLFYMTGYILSASGAQFLIDSLPVVGPIDSWIGLKMTSNWDNVFGTSLGVGIHSRPQCEEISRKDLRSFFRFQAYCARQPLCWQRVAGHDDTSTEIVGQQGPPSWRRQRDTDIVYSGCNGLQKRRIPWMYTS